MKVAAINGDLRRIIQILTRAKEIYDLDSNINITIPEVFKPSIMNSKTSYDYSYSYDQNGNSCEFGCFGECGLKIQTVLGFKNANEFANFLLNLF